MEDHPWSAPVTVLGPRGIRRTVATTAQAAEFLLTKWPAGHDTRAARQACLEVLAGRRRTDAARYAFKAAARDAGILCGGNVQAELRGLLGRERNKK